MKTLDIIGKRKLSQRIVNEMTVFRHADLLIQSFH